MFQELKLKESPDGSISSLQRVNKKWVDNFLEIMAAVSIFAIGFLIAIIVD